MVDTHGYDRSDLIDMVEAHIGVSTDRAGVLVDEAVAAVGSIYPWPWRMVTESLSISAGDTETALRADFEGLAGLPSYSDDTYEIRKVWTPERIYAKRAHSDQSGWPWAVAVEAVEHDPSDGQAYQLLCWPTPASDLTLLVPMLLRPKRLTNNDDYPPGSIQYHLAIAYWAMAIEEETAGGSDGAGGMAGPLTARAQQYVQQAIATTRTQAGGVELGRMTRALRRRRDDDLNMGYVTHA